MSAGVDYGRAAISASRQCVRSELQVSKNLSPRYPLVTDISLGYSKSKTHPGHRWLYVKMTFDGCVGYKFNRPWFHSLNTVVARQSCSDGELHWFEMDHADDAVRQALGNPLEIMIDGSFEESARRIGKAFDLYHSWALDERTAGEIWYDEWREFQKRFLRRVRPI